MKCKVLFSLNKNLKNRMSSAKSLPRSLGVNCLCMAVDFSISQLSTSWLSSPLKHQSQLQQMTFFCLFFVEEKRARQTIYIKCLSFSEKKKKTKYSNSKYYLL